MCVAPRNQSTSLPVRRGSFVDRCSFAVASPDRSRHWHCCDYRAQLDWCSACDWMNPRLRSLGSQCRWTTSWHSTESTEKVKPNKFKRPTDEFHALVLPAIASLVIYHESLQPQQHYGIITALNSRVLTGIASVCINTMTILILEMPEALMRKLPDVLLQMSKMSDTNALATPVLEFTRRTGFRARL